MIDFDLNAIDAAGGPENINKGDITVNIQHEENSLPKGFDPMSMSFAPINNEDKIRDLRARLKSSDRDPLAQKQEEMARGLEEIGLSREDLGKTGDSLTGKVTDKNIKIANSQTEDAKLIMQQRHLVKQR